MSRADCSLVHIARRGPVVQGRRGVSPTWCIAHQWQPPQLSLQSAPALLLGSLVGRTRAPQLSYMTDYAGTAPWFAGGCSKKVRRRLGPG